MSLRVLIVDDEPWARERIRSTLDDMPNVEVAAECGGGRDAVAAIQEISPDLVFLDVQMPDLDGFGVVAKVGPDRMPPVIFVTAFDEHALRAFEVHAIDYLVKPFDRSRLQDAVSRLIAEPRGGSDRDLVHRMQRLEDLVRDIKPSTYLERLMIRGEGRLYFVDVADLHYAESAGNYVRLHDRDGSHLLRSTLSRLAEQLDPRRFQRIHRSSLVALAHVAELQPLFAGDYAVVLKSGRRLTLSKTYRDGVLARLEQG